MSTSITTFTLAQLMIDTDNHLYWIDVGNFSDINGEVSTSLFHLSLTPEALSFDLLWIGGFLRLTGFRKDKYDDDNTTD